jgi:hypothetical protein
MQTLNQTIEKNQAATKLAQGLLQDLASYARCGNHEEWSLTWEQLQRTLNEVLNTEYTVRELEKAPVAPSVAQPKPVAHEHELTECVQGKGSCYHNKSYSAGFKCPTCGRVVRANLNYLGIGRRVYCNGKRSFRLNRSELVQLKVDAMHGKNTLTFPEAR